uniref:B cell scaffold protein with ankyrin repeats 1 n=1 Tax=Astyanax mexicanus TaxID=7994 RepID=A0A3B1IZ82_ASTMX
MSKASEDLLIIYESEAEQWASYLRSLLADSIPEAGICCYDIGMVTSRRDNFLQLSNYKCKLLILSRGMLEGLCQLRRFFLAHVLRPEARVVVLLCGVDSLTPLLELIPLKGEECLLISSEQDAQEYRSAVAEIVRRGGQTSDIRPAQELNRIKLERKQSAVASNEKPSLLILPSRVPCEAFRVSSKEELDQILASSLMRKMPAGGFQGLLNDQTAAAASHSEEIPTLLHFAAQHGLKDLASAVLQCPGAQQALRTRNRLGHTPLVLAHSYGHSQLHVFLQESLALSSADDCSDDASVYELMGSAGSLQVSHSHDQPQTGEARDDDDKQPVEQEEDPYAHLGANDEEYDSILTSGSSVAIVNRPPAPTPRPETLPAKEDNMPFIAQVFQKKKSQADSETLYSFSTKQNRGRDSISCTYDTFMPNQPPGLDELIKLQEQVKKGSLSMDEALDRFTDWQRLQRGLDSIQQEKLKQLRQSIISNREDDDSVYDKINIVHHTPSVTTDECRRGSQQAETDFYSKPLKGQNSNFFWKADKR